MKTKQEFIEAVKSTEVYKKIGNTAIQKLFLRLKNQNEFYENYLQSLRYGIDYIKQKTNIDNRWKVVIEEILKSE
jgi:predicted solute-binding protein